MIQGTKNGTTCGTVAQQPFHTTVPRNEIRGTAERISAKALHRRIFHLSNNGTANPSREEVLTSLSGRSVSLLSLGRTIGTVGSSWRTSLVPTNDPSADVTKLIRPLSGRPVIALTEAAIQSAGAIVVYRKSNKPALGPVGDSLDDMGAAA
jgi:hypothetical protein